MNLSSFTALSQCVGSVFISFFFFFPLVLSGLVGLFLAALVVQDLLPAFSWYSVRTVVDVFPLTLLSLQDLSSTPPMVEAQS